MRLLILLFCMVFPFGAVYAEKGSSVLPFPAVKDQIYQKGAFRINNCGDISASAASQILEEEEEKEPEKEIEEQKNGETPPAPEKTEEKEKPVTLVVKQKACLCQADIHYPLLSGLTDRTVQGKINNTLKQAAIPLKCEGPAAGKGVSRALLSPLYDRSFFTYYTVTLLSPEIISLEYDYATHYQPSVHGNSVVKGLIIDLATGKEVGLAELFDPASLAEINQIIYSSLLQNAGEEYKEAVTHHRNNFITEGGCASCTVSLSKDGVNVIFQNYEFAPLAKGNPVVTIPAKYIVSPLLRQNFGEHNFNTGTK